MYAFDLVERRAKRGVGVPDVPPRRIGRVGIVGAGLMATQLATLFLRRLEVPVVLTDVDEERVEAGLERIRGDLAELVAKGRLAEGKARFLGEIVSGGLGYERFAECDLVLEAVFEELAVKQEVFGALEEVVSDECILATNTSSLSVTEMARGLRVPERVVGLHFFNPVALLPLVEVVATPFTDDATLATAWDVTRKLRKTGVLVKDAPAFVVNRLLARLGSVVTDALDHGNTVEETDEAVLRLGLPMAPSVLTAMVGPRVANHVRHTLHEAFPDRFPLSATLESLAEGGDVVVVEERRPHRRADPRGGARGARGRGAAHPRGRRRRLAEGHRHVPAARRGLPVLPRRHHEAPGRDGRLGTRPWARVCRLDGAPRHAEATSRQRPLKAAAQGRASCSGISASRVRASESETADGSGFSARPGSARSGSGTCA